MPYMDMKQRFDLILEQMVEKYENENPKLTEQQKKDYRSVVRDWVLARMEHNVEAVADDGN